MFSALSLQAEFAGSQMCVGEEGIEEGRFSDAAMTEEGGGSTGQSIFDGIDFEILFSGSFNASIAERFVELDVELVDFFGKFPLINDDEGIELPMMSADEVAVDETRFKGRRADAGDDDEGIEVCDESFCASRARVASFDEARARQNLGDDALIVSIFNDFRMDIEFDSVARYGFSLIIFMTEQGACVRLLIDDAFAVEFRDEDDGAEDFDDDSVFHEKSLKDDSDQGNLVPVHSPPPV